jgi:predicted permease
MQIVQDIKYAFRLLRNTPVSTAVTMTVLVLGLSLYLASYSTSKMMTDEPMPFPDGDSYVSLKTIVAGPGSDNGFNNYDQYAYNFLKNNAQSYSTVGAFTRKSIAISDGDYARRYSGAAITSELLAATSALPVLGRIFTAEDSAIDAVKVVLLGHAVWQESYAGDIDIIGKVAQIGGRSHTIIGVMPAEFQFPLHEDLWLPMHISESSQPGEEPLSIVGILKEGISHSAAGVELNELMQQLIAEYPTSYNNRTELVVPYASLQWLKSSRIGDLAYLMTTMTSIILALTVINLSSLLFIRSTSRQQELVVRSSVGASRFQLAKQVLLESFVICISGLLLSLIFSTVMLRILQAQMSNFIELDFWFNLRLDSGAVLTGVVTTTIVWLASGLLGAFKAYRSELGGSSGSEAVNIGSGKHGKSVTTKLIVTAEMILSCFLLICCGFLIYLMQHITSTNVGVTTENYSVATFNLSLPDYNDQQSQSAYLDTLTQNILLISGITSAAITSAVPGQPGLGGNYGIGDRDLEVNDQFPSQTSVWIDSDYFNTIGIDVLQGRSFDGSDTEDSDRVVVISQEFASQLWPGDSAIGKQISRRLSEGEQLLTVVGTIPTLLQFPFRTQLASPALYLPLSQELSPRLFVIVEHESQLSGSDLELALNLAAGNADQRIPLYDFQTLNQKISSILGIADLIAPIFSVIALAALFLASIGIYGVVARSIFQRTHEIGVRRALGSSDSRIVAQFVRQGLLYLLTALVVGGVPACLIVLTAIPSFIEIAPTEFLPMVLSTVVLVMMLLILAASYLPASRVVRIEPGDALRYE